MVNKMNSFARSRIPFKIPDDINTIALLVSSSYYESFVDFQQEVPLDNDRVARYLVPKRAGDDNIVLNIIPVGGIVLDKGQREKKVGYLTVERDRYPEGYVTLEKLEDNKWKITTKEPQAYLLKAEKYQVDLDIDSLDECSTSNEKRIDIETKNVIDYLVVCKELRDEIEGTLYLLLPVDKIAEIIIKRIDGETETAKRYKILWSNGKPDIVELSENQYENLLV